MSNNCNSSYTPFMFGDSYGPSGSAPSPQRCTDEFFPQSYSVRDCLQWPTDSPGCMGKFGGNHGDSSCLGNGIKQMRKQAECIQQMQREGKMSTINARVQVPGGKCGEGECQFMNVPCKLAPAGTDPSTLMQPMEPLTFNVKAPARDPSGAPAHIDLSNVAAARVRAANPSTRTRKY